MQSCFITKVLLHILSCKDGNTYIFLINHMYNNWTVSTLFWLICKQFFLWLLDLFLEYYLVSRHTYNDWLHWIGNIPWEYLVQITSQVWWFQLVHWKIVWRKWNYISWMWQMVTVYKHYLSARTLIILIIAIWV